MTASISSASEFPGTARPHHHLDGWSKTFAMTGWRGFGICRST
jgi:aspartate/methionine/tyrosine aminotransferase